MMLSCIFVTLCAIFPLSCSCYRETDGLTGWLQAWDEWHDFALVHAATTLHWYDASGGIESPEVARPLAPSSLDKV